MKIIFASIIFLLFGSDAKAENNQDFFSVIGVIKSFTPEIIEIGVEEKTVIIPRSEILGNPAIKLGKRISISVKFSGLDQIKNKK